MIENIKNNYTSLPDRPRQLDLLISSTNQQPDLKKTPS